MIRKEKKTTKSHRKFAYKSFTESLNALSVKNATKALRADLRGEISDDSFHLEQGIEIWKETNISKNFSEFLYEIDQYANSLAQLLFHKSKVWQIFAKFIQLKDNLSLEPILDLLVRFIRDLGDEFLEFYEECVKILIETSFAFFKADNSQQNHAHTNEKVVEWFFNSLAFIFKYLQKDLVKDLTPTLKIVCTCLKRVKNNFFVRFIGETVSNLVKKCSNAQLEVCIEFLITSLDECDTQLSYSNLNKFSIVVFAEAMKNVFNAYDSKIEKLLKVLVKHSIGNSFTSVYCGVVLLVLKHGNEENVSVVYETTFAELETKVSSSNVESVLSILCCLAFADAGRKFKNWNLYMGVCATISDVLKHDNTYADTVMEKLIVFYSFVIRNAPMDFLAKFHLQVLDTLQTAKNADWFLPFVQTSTGLNKPKTTILFQKKAQDFILHSWHSHESQIATYLTKYPSAVQQISKEFQQSLLKDIKSNTANSDELNWRLSLLMYGKDIDDLDILMGLVTDSKNGETTGLALKIVTNEKRALCEHEWEVLASKADDLVDSGTFVEAVHESLVLKKPESSETVEKLSNIFTTSLLSGVRQIRYSSLKIVTWLIGTSVSPILNSVQTVESTELSLPNGRDIAHKIRQIGANFANADESSQRIVLHWVFGYLGNRFKPIWDAIYDVADKFSANDELWPIALKFLQNAPKNEITFDEFEDEEDEGEEDEDEDEDEDAADSEDVEMETETSAFAIDIFSEGFFDEKFHGIVSKMVPVMRNYAVQEDDIISNSETFMRTQTLQFLIKAPKIAEKHARDVVPMLLNSEGWLLKDKNLLLELFGKFRNPKSIYESEKVLQFAKDLLTSRTTSTQKLALELVLTYKLENVNKYTDNLRNMLNDTIFKDEIVTFFNANEAEDLEAVVDIVLRILFGKFKTKVTSNSKQSVRNAILKMLPKLHEKFVVKFLQLGCAGIEYQEMFASDGQVLQAPFVEFSETQARKLVGFVNFFASLVKEFKTKFPQVLATGMQPLIYCLVMAQRHIDNNVNSGVMGKVYKTLRSSGMKILAQIFSFGTEFSWTPHIDAVYRYIIEPRLAKFAADNKEQVSSLLQIMTGWAKVDTFFTYLNYDDYKPVKALMQLFSDLSCKPSVQIELLQFSAFALANCDSHVQQKVLETCFQVFPSLDSRETLTEMVNVLLVILRKNLMSDQETLQKILDRLCAAISGGACYNNEPVFEAVLGLVRGSKDTDFTHGFLSCWKAVSEHLEVQRNAQIREIVCQILLSIAEKFTEYTKTAETVVQLNAMESRRIEEPDFEKRVAGFKTVQNMHSSWSAVQWVPIVSQNLFDIKSDEPGIRHNARLMLQLFVDTFSQKDSEKEASPYIDILNNRVLPAMRMELRKMGKTQQEFIGFLEHLVGESRFFSDLDDMKCLFFSDDEEASFFVNVVHVQVHRRQRAVRRLATVAESLGNVSVSQYLMPIVEQFVFCDDEQLRNLSNDAIETMGALAKRLGGMEFRGMLKRYGGYLKKRRELYFKEVVRLIVAVSDGSDHVMIDAKYDHFFGVLMRVLNERDDTIAVSKIPLSQAVVSLSLSLPEEEKQVQVAAAITKLAQMLRSKSEEVRDTVRKSLAVIAAQLGPEYLLFIINELKGALRRGAQIHVLSFTVHHLLVATDPPHGALDASCEPIMDMVMDDTFGSAAAEKDAEEYRSSKKEVKHNKSNDTVELLASKISLEQVGAILVPVKTLLREQLGAKAWNKACAICQRLTGGLARNPAVVGSRALTLCFQLLQEADERNIRRELREKSAKPEISESEEHFLVQLEKRARFAAETSTGNNTQWSSFARRVSLDLSHSLLSSEPELFQPHFVKPFFEYWRVCLKNSDDEAVLVGALRAVGTCFTLELDEESKAIVAKCTKSAFRHFQNQPSTNTSVAQSCLKYFAAAVRASWHPATESETNYVLGRLLPDLDDPSRQGLAFKYLRAVLSAQVKTALVYDVMEKVGQILVTNHTKSVRDMARACYLQFIMEYDHGKAKLESIFRQIVGNLSYPAEAGRDSVLELVAQLVIKTPKAIFTLLSTSFFVALSRSATMDSTPRVRERASDVLKELLTKSEDSESAMTSIHSYLAAWMRSDNWELVRCAAHVYKLYIESLGANAQLNEVLFERLDQIFENEQWESVYSVLLTLGKLFGTKKSLPKSVWPHVTAMLLFPHSWVRLAAARLTGSRLQAENAESSLDLSSETLQEILTRSVRQVAAPKITTDLSECAVRNSVLCLVKLQQTGVPEEFLQTCSAIAEKLSKIARNDYKAQDFVNSKKGGIKLMAMILQLLNEDQLQQQVFFEPVLLAILPISEDDPTNGEDADKDELIELSTETAGIYESKVGNVQFARMRGSITKQINERRLERRAKKAQLAVSNPELAAQKKIKKHAKSRAKRKVSRDENGQYKGKKKRRM